MRHFAGGNTEALSDGRIIEIADLYSFTPEDRPDALADALASFAV